MRLIVEEVVHQMCEQQGFGEPLAKPEGCTWYPDGRCFCLTREETPTWLNGIRARRRALAQLRQDRRYRV